LIAGFFMFSATKKDSAHDLCSGTTGTQARRHAHMRIREQSPPRQKKWADLEDAEKYVIEILVVA
jgi:hypothetical protein